MRSSLGLTQLEFGKLISQSSVTISRWENGNRLPSAEDLYHLSQATGYPIESFFHDERAALTSQLASIIRDLPPEEVEELVGIAKIKRHKVLRSPK